MRVIDDSDSDSDPEDDRLIPFKPPSREEIVQAVFNLAATKLSPADQKELKENPDPLAQQKESKETPDIIEIDD